MLEGPAGIERGHSPSPVDPGHLVQRGSPASSTHLHHHRSGGAERHVREDACEAGGPGCPGSGRPCHEARVASGRRERPGRCRRNATYARCPVGRYHPCLAPGTSILASPDFRSSTQSSDCAQRLLHSEKSTPRAPGRGVGNTAARWESVCSPGDRRRSACIGDPAQGEVFTRIDHGVVIEPCRGRDEDRICQRDCRPSDDGHLLQLVALAERDPLPVRGEHRQRRASRPHERSGGVLGPLLHPELGSPVLTGTHVDQPGTVGGERHQSRRSLALREGEAVAGHRPWQLGSEPAPERQHGARRRDGTDRERDLAPATGRGRTGCREAGHRPRVAWVGQRVGELLRGGEPVGRQLLQRLGHGVVHVRRATDLRHYRDRGRPPRSRPSCHDRPAPWRPVNGGSPVSIS